MNNKISAIIQMILYPIYFITLALPLYYEVHIAYYSFTEIESFYDRVLSDFVDNAWLWFVIMLVAAILSLYMCVSRLADSGAGKLPKIFSLSQRLCLKNRFYLTYILPLICALSLVAYTLITEGDKVHVSNYEYYYEHSDDIFIMIPLAVTVLMIINSIIDCIAGRKATETANYAQNNAYAQPNQYTYPAQTYAPPVQPTVPSIPTTDVADEIKKLKELLDMGAITQEEYDTKKKQILGL